jgi:flagellar biosynthetic protein FliR
VNLVAQDLLAGSPAFVMLFVLVLARLSGMFLLAPIFGSHIAPLRARAALLFFIAITMMPLLSLERGAELVEAGTVVTMLGAVVREVLIGSAIGLASQFAFGGMQLAGQLGGIQMGAGLSNLVDPQTGERLTTMAQWSNVVALLVFLAVDGHHLLIRAVAESFGLVEIGGGLPNVEGIGLLLLLAGSIFVIGLKVAAPVMLLVLMVNAAMGVLAKVIPQLNVFIVGFPLNVAAGLFGLLAALPYTIQLLGQSFGELAGSILAVLEGLG